LGQKGRVGRNSLAKLGRTGMGCQLLMGQNVGRNRKNTFEYLAATFGLIQINLEFKWKFVNFLEDRNLNIGQRFRSNNFELKLSNILKLNSEIQCEDKIKEYGNSTKQIRSLT
jgi:hypothetical protein